MVYIEFRGMRTESLIDANLANNSHPPNFSPYYSDCSALYFPGKILLVDMILSGGADDEYEE